MKTQRLSIIMLIVVVCCVQHYSLALNRGGIENGFMINEKKGGSLMKPISDDLRTRIVNVYEETQLSYPKVAARFQVSESSVRRFVKQWREQGTITPQPQGGGHLSKLDDADVALVAELANTEVDATQDELREMVAKHTGTLVSQPTICRTLQRASITRKKNDTCYRAGAGGCESGSPDLSRGAEDPSGGRHYCG